MYYGKGSWTHSDLETMPIYWRKWYHMRLIDQLETEERQRMQMMSKR